MNMTNALLLFAACTSLAPTAMAATGHAHEHGVASLNVARSGGSLLIELDGPWIISSDSSMRHAMPNRNGGLPMRLRSCASLPAW